MFNSVLLDLIGDLHKAFPDDLQLSALHASAGTYLKFAPNTGISSFTSSFGTKPDKIAQKDDTIFVDFPSLGGIPVRGLWNLATPANKECIWAYIQHLQLISTLVAACPPDILAAAQQQAKVLESSLAGSNLQQLAENVLGPIMANPKLMEGLTQGLMGRAAPTQEEAAEKR